MLFISFRRSPSAERRKRQRPSARRPSRRSSRARRRLRCAAAWLCSCLTSAGEPRFSCVLLFALCVSGRQEGPSCADQGLQKGWHLRPRGEANWIRAGPAARAVFSTCLRHLLSICRTPRCRRRRPASRFCRSWTWTRSRPCRRKSESQARKGVYFSH